MPTLEFKGKQFVYSHHLSVPFRELKVEAKKSLPEKGKKPSLDDNLIIHGDNLEALKALLPTHAGKVDCIFIDPPYNTGEEGWCYNDNVRSPLMKEWLKKSANPVDLGVVFGDLSETQVEPLFEAFTTLPEEQPPHPSVPCAAAISFWITCTS